MKPKISSKRYRYEDLASMLKKGEIQVEQDDFVFHACYFTNKEIKEGYKLKIRESDGSLNRIYVSKLSFDQILDYCKNVE